MGDFSAFFSPITINNTHLRNRIAMAPMSRYFARDGVPPEDAPDYYARRARGGAALIITEGAAIPHPLAALKPTVPCFHDDALPVWTRVAEAVHREGSAILAQLWHAGLMRSGEAGHAMTGGMGPSSTMPAFAFEGIAMEKADIDEVVAAYAQAGAAAHRLGFDGINIHGAHGYLIDEFMWQGTNTRHDDYGGSDAARLRFAQDVVKAIRQATSPSFMIMFRFSQWKSTDYGARLAETPGDLARHLEPLVDAGVDVFDASTRRFWLPEFPGSDMNLAGWAKHITGKPSMSVGSVSLEGPRRNTPKDQEIEPELMLENLAEAHRFLERGDFDLLAVGRAMIANPAWANLVAEGKTSWLVPYRREMLEVLQ